MRIPAVCQFIFAVTFFCTGQFAFAQNLVPNPGFEIYKKLPYRFSVTPKDFTNNVEAWNMPNQATSDYFNLKCGGKVKAKRNFAGVQTPKEGGAYAGFIAYTNVNSDYREYLQVKLDSKLKAGKTYVIQFYVSLAEQSEYAIDRLGVLVCRKEMDQQNQTVILQTPTTETAEHVFYDDETNWVCIRSSFVANGKEHYLIIGNFRKGREMHLKAMQVNKKKYFKENETYYYIDDVCLSLANEDGSSSCLCAPNDTALVPVIPEIAKQDSTIIPVIDVPKENTAIVFTSVLFDTDKSELKPSSFPALDSLADYLDAHQEYQIEIGGHTDNSGDEEKNKILSQQRAQAVANYLIDNGINPARITYVGYGSSQPIADNTTPEGKAKNRRVEYKLHR